MTNLEKINLQIKKYRFSLPIFILYVVFLCFVSYYHEPWHDEGQAWLIARDDSLWQLLTETTHYEGHPPLWHLSLMPFAKLGVSFSFGLKTINIFFSSCAMGLLIFKSPLPLLLRFTLPFTYFFFYQYGVVNRSYSLLMLGTMLTAYFYSQRQEHPYKLSLSLALLAGSQAYGMMFACGVAIVWLVELCRRKRIRVNNVLNLFLEEQEGKALSLLFFLSLGLGLSILPYKDTAFTNNGIEINFWENIFYLFTVMPGQFLLSNTMQSNVIKDSLEFFLANLKIYWQMISTQGVYAVLIAIQWVVSYIYGLFFNLGLGYFCWQEKMLALFLCPLLLMNLLGSLVYWNMYHTGVWACFYVFILWQLWSNKESFKAVKDSLQSKFTYHWEFLFVKGGLLIFCLAVLLTNFSWSWEASKNNFLYDTDASSAIAKFIKDNKLTNYKIWTGANFTPNATLASDNVATGAYAINCYFDNNVLQNLDGGNTNHAYHEYKLLPKEKYFEQVRKFGQPDFIIGREPKLEDVFSHPAKYIVIETFQAKTIWKNSATKFYVNMYMRKDLLKDFPQFPEIKEKI
jgi:hypothetical protein